MNETSPHGFDIVRRGYARTQVDDRIAALVADRDSALSRIASLEQRVAELEHELRLGRGQIGPASESA